MTETPARRKRPPRLDSGARGRLLARISRLDHPPVSEIERTTDELRDILRHEPAPETDTETDTDGATDPPPASDRPDAARPEASSDTHPAPGPDPQHNPGPGPDPDAVNGPLPATRAPWTMLRQFPLDPAHLDRNLVITAGRTDPAHGAFNVLRTRLTQALADKGWSRVAITSPTPGCGKSFTAINLAITLSRYESCRTLLLDLDMRRPRLHRYVGVDNPGSIGDVLRGLTLPEDHLLRPGPNNLHVGDHMALGLNGQVEPYAAELLQQPQSAAILARMARSLDPQVILYDMPPALAQDDVIAARDLFDCLLIVVGGGTTTADEVNEATRRIGEDKPILGVILNRAEIESDDPYYY